MIKDKILLVEDSKSQAEEIYRMLISENYDVTIKENGAKAFDYLKQQKHADLPHIVITDLYMPEMDGIELCRKLKLEIAPDIPVLFLTIEKDENNIERAFEAGASDYVRKPPPKIEFIVRIRNLIRLKKNTESYRKSIEELKSKQDKLKEYSIKDELTGAFNRSFIIKEFIKKTYDAARYNTRFSFSLFGVDKMREINHKYGQKAGDILLREIGAAVREKIRLTDIIGRYEGDTFVMIFPNIKKDEAVTAIMKVHKLINEISINKIQNISVTVSSCVINYDTTVFKNYVEALSKASELLSEAKAKGPGSIEVL